MRTRQNYEPKPLFLERMKKLLGNEIDSYLEILKKPLTNSIRCNTLKISPEELLGRLKSRGWFVEQPFPDNKEIMIVKGKSVNDKNDFNDEDIANKKSNLNDNKDEVDSYIKNSLGREGGKEMVELEPGELGRSMEHLLGYYYIQEISSMLSVLALQPKPEELVLDIAAAPGSKTTQLAAVMENKGTIVANDVSLKRLKILASNLERCGATNTIITRKDGIALCRKLKDASFQFDKILVDAPCSGEGTIRSSPRGFQMWNIHTVKSLSKLQKAILASALEILKIGGELVYSTCTHAPEENEEVVDFILKEFGNKISIESINLPVKCRQGVTKWLDKNYDKSVESACRIYPQDNDTEGFFIAKLRRMK